MARKHPKNATVRSLLASSHLDLGQPREALRLLERLAADRPKDADVHYNRGLALIELDCVTEAISAYQTSLALAPEHARAHFNLAVALKQAGKDHDARCALEHDLAIAPSVDTLRLLRDWANNSDDAINYARRTIETEGAELSDLNSYNALRYEQLAELTLITKGNREEAIALAEQAVLLDDRNIDALANLGRLRARLVTLRVLRSHCTAR